MGVKHKLVFYVRNCETGEEHGKKSPEFIDGGPINQVVFDLEPLRLSQDQEAKLAAIGDVDGTMRTAMLMGIRREMFKAIGTQVERFLATTLAPIDDEPARAEKAA